MIDPPHLELKDPGPQIDLAEQQRETYRNYKM